MEPIETKVLRVDAARPEQGAIDEAAAALRRGGLVAFPTETVYGLGANALDAAAVGRIFAAKGRPAFDPLIVHLFSLAQLDEVAVAIPDRAWALARAFWPGPLTLVLQRHPALPEALAAGRTTVAVRMPNHPVAAALLRSADLPVAAPSANLFSRPSPTLASHVLDDLAGRIDLVLDGGPASIGLESTVLDLTQESPVVLRPGGITLEALRPSLPDVTLATKYLAVGDAAGAPASPGMLTKHYSPSAAVLLVSGPAAAVDERMRAELARLRAAGDAVGVMAPADEQAAWEAAGA
ncbi:MAG TPA: L-threonylcarbamoyladenylate synthase, partial [Herpetosiphonaceae bacterium]